MKSGGPLPVTGIILAAGKGTRMQSDLPKVLHKVNGIPMIERVLGALEGAHIEEVCAVLSTELKPFASFLDNHKNIRVCIQKEQKGTADAVGSAAFAFEGVKPPSYVKGELARGAAQLSPYVLVCYGDMPGLSSAVLTPFVRRFLEDDCDIGLIAMKHPQPTGYGRVVLDARGNFDRIVEERDADSETKKVSLCNSGIVLARTSVLFECLNSVSPQNAQREYYLTDVFTIAKNRGEKLLVHITDDYRTFDGVNDRQQLAQMEAWLKKPI